MSTSLNQTYLYSMYPTYEKQLFTFIMTADRIDTKDESFSSILNDVRQRQVSNNMVKALTSDKICLMCNGTVTLGKAIKVFTAKDAKEAPDTKKTFIDVSGIISKNDSGMYHCTSIDSLISYLLAAITQVIYYSDDSISRKLTDNVSLTKFGASAYSKLFFNVVDYITKISSINDAKEKCKALTAIYYQVCLLDKEYNSPGVNNIAKQVSGISERMLTSILIDYDESNFVNLKAICDTISTELRLPKITVEAIVAKWMYIYDPSTTFGLELFPYFSSMISNAYIGAYLNNQKTIQKVIDTDMVQFTKTLINIEGAM